MAAIMLISIPFTTPRRTHTRIRMDADGFYRRITVPPLVVSHDDLERAGQSAFDILVALQGIDQRFLHDCRRAGIVPEGVA